MSNIEKVQSKFEEIDKFLQQSESVGPSLFFMGNTGVGKSTLINYLLGAKLKYTYDEM
jgi:putative ribosome biogenesis GTPase RsgA